MSSLSVWILDPPGLPWCHHQIQTAQRRRAQGEGLGHSYIPFFLAKSWTSGIGGFSLTSDYYFSFCFLLRVSRLERLLNISTPSVTPLWSCKWGRWEVPCLAWGLHILPGPRVADRASGWVQKIAKTGQEQSWHFPNSVCSSLIPFWVCLLYPEGKKKELTGSCGLPWLICKF